MQCFSPSDNVRAQDAMNMTFYHWGLHSWVVYVTVGLTMAFVSYRKGTFCHSQVFYAQMISAGSARML